MKIRGLGHLAIRTDDLAKTLSFYIEAMGFVEVKRPSGLTFPGAWLALPGEEDAAILHFYAGPAAVGPDGNVPKDNEQGIADHLALRAQGFVAFRDRFIKHGVAWRAQHLQGSNNWQMFVHDPNGLKIELAFNQPDETGLPVDIPEQIRYKASERFFIKNSS